MDDDAFPQNLLAEMLGRFLHADEIDAQERRRLLLLEIQREFEPFVAVHGGRLDREIDVRALEVVAAGARAEQPDPLDRRMPGEQAGELGDQLAARAIGGQGRRSSSVAAQRPV
jgi:hypothetical protein